MTNRVKDTDKGWKALLKKAREDPHVVTIGLQGAKGDEQHTDTTMTNAHLASVHEFGAVVKVGSREITIPERSFIRSTVDKNKGYRALCSKIGQSIIAGRIPDFVTALGILGEKVTSDIKSAIEQGIDPPNAPMTIARKGSSKPLIDTAQMKNAITYDVHKDDGRHLDK